MSSFTQVVLYTDSDGRAKFRAAPIELGEGTPATRLSAILPATGLQLRESPVGFRSQFHCSGYTQWVFILQGQMEIGLHDGDSRIFKPGEHFYSADLVPPNQTFDPALHGHWSRQVGPDELVTLFLRA